ncbi:4a-hydroxytetrahydrobiopterin dehydratase [Sessilibacter corallicola]|uniref:4a-hydroxytetrahydrobiopterin dehydratase n=1 Tax=Sessilibacter corallicola TaxID=2904075 RepID=UPI001E6130A3|nr:4a-hydroxytetrahydrobiopterin dehydratase [Sessilibacter corallicola]MCE2028743.1 4a-hydroxytetrahydrobiopterin dehydratase [Sessilibacter corallicola]
MSQYSQMNERDIDQELSRLIGWIKIESEGIAKLEKVFSYRDYQQAVQSAQRVADLADEHNHHPLLIIEWGKLTVQWWTHTANGLSETDFNLARATDDLLFVPQ